MLCLQVSGQGMISECPFRGDSYMALFISTDAFSLSNMAIG